MLAEKTGICQRSILRIMAQDQVSFDLADRIVTFLEGPMTWYDDPELKTIYMGAEL